MKQTISHKIKPILIGASLINLGIGFIGGWNDLHALLPIGFLAFIALKIKLRRFAMQLYFSGDVGVMREVDR